MPDPKPSAPRRFEAEAHTSNGLRLVKEDALKTTRETESLPESSTGAPRDLVERLMDRLKKI